MDITNAQDKLIKDLEQLKPGEAQARMDAMLAKAVVTYPPGLDGRIMQRYGISQEEALDLIEEFGG
jgi:hypothetical protein